MLSTINFSIKSGFICKLMIPAALLLLNACEEKEYAIPEAKTELQNDVLKRTTGPHVAGLDIEFAYAMALGVDKGRLVSATVEASVAGEEGTYMDPKSYYTDGSGEDIGVTVGEPSVTQGTRTSVRFVGDTSAATLRYYYKIPESAKGQNVSFNFSAEASTGEKVTYAMGPYKISRMDMKLDLAVKDSTACYISIADMAVYSPEEAAANPGKVDLVYLYRNIPNITFNHSLVAPSAPAEYLRGVQLPSGVNNSAKIRKVWGLRDQHLARMQFGVFVDDLDFEKLNLAAEPDYAINLRAESGTWVETADGKYRAYIFVNSVNNNGKSAVISIKRFAL